MLDVFRRRKENRAVVQRLYDSLVSRARNPFLYIEAGLPDTVMGRFEALSIEVFLFLARCRDEDRLRPLTQDLVDRFMRDVDHSIRELGVGYLAVPKRMRKLAAQFYGRIAAFEEPMVRGDEAALAAALSERSIGAEGGADPHAPGRLAHYMIEEHRRYAHVSVEEILHGALPEHEWGMDHGAG